MHFIDQMVRKIVLFFKPKETISPKHEKTWLMLALKYRDKAHLWQVKISARKILFHFFPRFISCHFFLCVNLPNFYSSNTPLKESNKYMLSLGANYKLLHEKEILCYIKNRHSVRQHNSTQLWFEYGIHRIIVTRNYH